MKTIDLLRLYHSHRASCCKCGCTLESDLDLGSVFILDYDGNFYCMTCDNIFEDGDEGIFEAEFFEWDCCDCELWEQGKDDGICIHYINNNCPCGYHDEDDNIK